MIFLARFVLVLLGCVLLLSPLARADETAVMTIKEEGGKTHRVVVEFYENDAPITVANFKKLSRKRFYNGVAVHRVFPQTLVQAGDPLSRKRDRARVGTGGPGYTLPPEFGRKHTVGAVAMSRLPDNINPARRSSGSQFYIALKPMPSLDGKYTVFGRVIEGMEALDAISRAGVDNNDYPLDRYVIKSCKIIPRT